MKVARIAAVVTAGLVVANTAANLAIRKAQNSTSVKHVVRDAASAVFMPAVVTYRKSATTAA